MLKLDFCKKDMLKTPKKSGLLNKGRHVSGKAIGTLGFCTSWAVDVRGKAPEWLEVTQLNLHLPNLRSQFKGLRLVHISDLHYSRIVSGKYLQHCIERINLLDADIVVLTGDYITHDIKGRFREKVANLLGSIQNRFGVYACLGNHDYGVGGMFKNKVRDLLEQMIDSMENNGVNILRNDSSVLEVDGQGLWLVGLGDLWAKDFDPEKAFKNVPEDEAVIALMHNPEGMKYLHKSSANVVMSGHTHGVCHEHSTKLGWSKRKRDFHAGLYNVRGKKLYVNRGLGRLGRARFNARPEITVCTLH